MSLTSRERVEIALSHKEPDRAPFDFGATGRAGFTIEAHDALLRALEIDDMTQAVSDPIRRLALPHEALPDHFPHDLVGSWMTPGELLPEDDDGEERYEWRIEHSVEASNEPSEDLDEELPPQRVERATDNFGIRWERRLPASAFRPITTPLAGDIPLARLNA
ncbi:MAG: hypothetical protein O3A46_05640, partial [Candidatus Poribacteria bacterium]|nr:hypothetical protein [Candidatus Poribacteria bacterium]